MTMGPNIVEKQNETSSIRCLAATRQIYSNAKTLFAFQIILTTVVVVLLSFINLIHNIEWILATYCVFVAVADSVCFDEFISKQKEKAAVIQEVFDTNVLSIEWNDFIEKVDHEIIYRYSEKYKKKEPAFNSLKNWYSVGIRDVVNEEAKIICQYSNCRYDLSLRKQISKYLFSLAIISSLLIVSFALIKDMTFKNIFILILLPLLPIIVFSIQRIKENNRSIIKLNKMKSIASKSWDKIIGREYVDLPKITRKIQNSIFKNRKNSPLIFDWFYNLHRASLENEMNYSVDQLVAQYKSANKQKNKG